MFTVVAQHQTVITSARHLPLTDCTARRANQCRLHWQFVFVRHSRHFLAHFRTARFLSLYLRQEARIFYLSDVVPCTCSLSSLAGDISTSESFLKALGRGSETKISFDTWDALWKTDGLALKKAGLAVRDRRCVAFYHSIRARGDRLDRYILWAMERYRQNDDPSEFAHEVKPKKKIRGCVSCSS